MHVETVSALSASDRETQCTDSLIRLTSVGLRTDGAKVAARILSDPALKALWYEDLQVMAGRISEMRRLLYEALTE